MVKHQVNGVVLWGVVVEAEAYSQNDPACHGYCRRSPQNKIVLDEPRNLFLRALAIHSVLVDPRRYVL